MPTRETSEQGPDQSRRGPAVRAAHRSFLPVDGKGGIDVCGPYEPVEGWPQPIEPGWRIAGAAGVCPESPDRVIVASHFGLVRERSTPLVWGQEVFTVEDSPFTHAAVQLRLNGTIRTDRPTPRGRPEHHVVIFNRAGEVVESWTWNDHLFGKLNRVFVNPSDPEHCVWVSDSVNQKIYAFSSDGKDLVMEVSAASAGSTEVDPWKGQDVAWLPNGDFYTAGLSRIDRFSSDGKLQFSLARRGDGPGEFADLHGLVLDQERQRIYVADRGNARIQVFDEDWNFLDQWQNILAPYTLRLSKDGFIWIGDGFTQRIVKYDLEGRLLLSWGQFGIAPGCTWGVHYFDTDDEGNLYIVEDYGDRVQKLRPRADVDPADPRLIGQLVRY